MTKDEQIALLKKALWWGIEPDRTSLGYADLLKVFQDAMPREKKLLRPLLQKMRANALRQGRRRAGRGSCSLTD